MKRRTVRRAFGVLAILLLCALAVLGIAGEGQPEGCSSCERVVLAAQELEEQGVALDPLGLLLVARLWKRR